MTDSVRKLVKAAKAMMHDWIEIVGDETENTTPADTLENLREAIAAVEAELARPEEPVLFKRDILETELACACDLANTWARESQVEECQNPYEDLGLRNLIDRLWARASTRIHGAGAELEQARETVRLSVEQTDRADADIARCKAELATAVGHITNLLLLDTDRHVGQREHEVALWIAEHRKATSDANAFIARLAPATEEKTT